MAKQNTAKTTAPVRVIGAGTAKPNFRAGSARALYYTAMQAHVGKPLAGFVQAVAANPPSMPTKGKLAGKAEPIKGWLSYFTRNGYFTIS